MGIPKRSAEDTTLTTVNRNGDRVVFPVPKDSYMLLHTPGLHYNREHRPLGILSFSKKFFVTQRNIGRIRIRSTLSVSCRKIGRATPSFRSAEDLVRAWGVGQYLLHRIFQTHFKDTC